MGQGSSKPALSTSQHVFTRYFYITPRPQDPFQTKIISSSETPVRFSQDLIDALQASPEVLVSPANTLTHTHPVRASLKHHAICKQTDSTRTKDFELLIQNRVHAELSRLSESTSASLTALEEQISSLPEPTPETGGGADFAARLKAENEQGSQDLGRESVQREIERLKKNLGRRKVREEVVKDEGVENARSKVLACLRTNDRKPLNCYEEVEAFRREVARLERVFLGRVLE